MRAVACLVLLLTRGTAALGGALGAVLRDFLAEAFESGAVDRFAKAHARGADEGLLLRGDQPPRRASSRCLMLP